MANVNPPRICQLTEQLRTIRPLNSDTFPMTIMGFSKEEVIRRGEGSMWMAGRVGEGDNIL
jgi:hypothetical protein